MKATGKTFVFLLVVVGGIAAAQLLLGSRPAELPPALQTEGSLGTAIERGRQSGKPVVAFATAEWCGPCQMLKRGALSDPRVTSYLEQNAEFVTLEETDESSHDALAALGVRGFPTLYIIEGGQPVANIMGAVPTDALLEWLRQHVPERARQGGAS